MTRYRMFVRLLVIKRGEGRDDRDAKGLLAVDFVGAQDAPRTLRVADSGLLRELIDRDGEIRPTQQTLFRQHIRQFQRSGTAEIPLLSIAHVGPTFQENAAPAVFL